MIILCITQFLLELHKVYLDQDGMELWYNNLLQTSGPQTQKLEAEGPFLTRELRACARASYRYHVGNGIRSLARLVDSCKLFLDFRLLGAFDSF